LPQRINVKLKLKFTIK